MRKPGAEYRFKSIFAWGKDMSGPLSTYFQLGEGITVLLLDTCRLSSAAQLLIVSGAERYTVAFVREQSQLFQPETKTNTNADLASTSRLEACQVDQLIWGATMHPLEKDQGYRTSLFPGRRTSIELNKQLAL